MEDFENLLKETYGRELEKAMKKGYVIVTLLEVWYFPETLEGLFRDYENTWKLADGKRKWVTIAYKAREGIDLDPSKIVSLEPWVALLG